MLLFGVFFDRFIDELRLEDDGLACSSAVASRNEFQRQVSVLDPLLDVHLPLFILGKLPPQLQLHPCSQPQTRPVLPLVETLCQVVDPVFDPNLVEDCVRADEHGPCAFHCELVNGLVIHAAEGVFADAVLVPSDQVVDGFLLSLIHELLLLLLRLDCFLSFANLVIHRIVLGHVLPVFDILGVLCNEILLRLIHLFLLFDLESSFNDLHSKAFIVTLTRFFDHSSQVIVILFVVFEVSDHVFLRRDFWFVDSCCA